MKENREQRRQTYWLRRCALSLGGVAALLGAVAAALRALL
jgi:hypothetical protein